MTLGRKGSAAVAALALVFTCALVTTPASAQQGCDPVYGCPSTTQPPAFEPVIEVRPPSSPAGRRVGVEACGYDPADDGQEGSITFNGEVVAQVTLDDDGCLAPGVASNGMPNSFVVPGLPPGEYQVCAVFAGYATPCTTFRITPGEVGGGNQGSDTEVLDREIARGSDERVLADGGERSRGLGPLARTGIGLGGLLAAALGLILGGRALTSHRRSTGADTADR